MSDDHELTLTARGTVRVVTTTETEGMTVEQSELQDVTAELALDADRLYSSDVATTHRGGAVIPTSDVAAVVCTEIGATLANPNEWNITVSGSLDDWQKVALGAAKQKLNSGSKRARLAIDVLLSLHEGHAESDRPLYAALNIDETYGVGCRDEILDQLADDDDQVAAAEEVTADA